MKRFCPAAFQFAVIRMDPVAMVEHFDDPIATAEAHALVTKKYLVYLDLGVDMPFPTNRWFRYKVRLIGSTLRPADPANGITPDMVIPIYPNTFHPSGRTPIVPETPFPFTNCYFWLGSTVEVRIRHKADMYNDSYAVKLSTMEHVAIELGFSNDFRRLHRFRKSQQAAAAAPSHDPHDMHDAGHVVGPRRQRPIPVPFPQLTSSSQDSCLSGSSNQLQPRSTNNALASSSEDEQRRCDSPHQHTAKYDPEVEAILSMDIFNLAHDDAAEYLLLVNLWFELTEHLAADSIPDPFEFFKERDTIVKYVRPIIALYELPYDLLSFQDHP
ncbi:hypothetical protein PYCCODRAFT_1378485 [Trametes coccinea BRFM310]|uniref:Uncharacterized protein n=1 Tax=Trametes coccinea (strain BRFM310) TaxID=1353009 RepID=A0A1Y2I6J5_TRAC3|nr:hypothetical protein PYCCODRAFT_1378485 [Trametes coccinea BRFM310]